MSAFILRVEPALTIWYHQPLDEVYGSDPHIAVPQAIRAPERAPVPTPSGATRNGQRWERTRFPQGRLRRRVPRRPDLRGHGQAQRGRGADARAPLVARGLGDDRGAGTFSKRTLPMGTIQVMTSTASRPACTAGHRC